MPNQQKQANESIYNKLGLDNLAKNILLKKSILGISLQEFANNCNVNYAIILKLINHEKVMPTLSTLEKIADYFKVKIADLLISGNLPQYIPKFSSAEYSLIYQYLQNNTINRHKNFEFIESSLSENSFALDFDTIILGQKKTITIFFMKYQNSTLESGKKYFIQSSPQKLNNSIPQYFFVEVLNENNQEIIVKPVKLATSIDDNLFKFKMEEIEILGVAKKIKINEFI